MSHAPRMSDFVACAGGQDITIEDLLSGRATSALEADFTQRHRAAAAAAAQGRSGTREEVTARLAEKYKSVQTSFPSLSNMGENITLLCAQEHAQRSRVRDLVCSEGVGAPATLAGLRILCSRVKARGDEQSRVASLGIAQDVHWLAGGAEEECATLGSCCPAPSCGTPLSRYRRCGACEWTKYCGPDCSAAHWKTHKPVCKVLRGCLPKDFPDSAAK